MTVHLLPIAEMTFAEILAPVHQYSQERAETDEESGAFAGAEVAAYRAERPTIPDHGTHESAASAQESRL